MKRFACLLGVLLLFPALALAATADAIVVAPYTAKLTAPFSGTLLPFDAQQGDAVSAGDVLYMVGGQYYVEGQPDSEGKPTYDLVASNKIFRSIDGIHWTALEGENAVPETFTGRTRPCTVVVGDMLWIFGGRGTTNGYYGAPDAADDVIFDTWKKVIK